jgi:hypothetical protein
MRYYWMALFVMVLLGWNLHQDFGLSWDEPIVLMYGQQMMTYFSEGDASFSTAFDRYHGSFPSLWMAGVDSFFADLPSQERFFGYGESTFSSLLSEDGRWRCWVESRGVIEKVCFCC